MKTIHRQEFKATVCVRSEVVAEYLPIIGKVRAYFADFDGIVEISVSEAELHRMIEDALRRKRRYAKRGPFQISLRQVNVGPERDSISSKPPEET